MQNVPHTNTVMVDIETLDTKPTAVVVSIGAIIFNPFRPLDLMSKNQFYIEIDVNKQYEDLNRTVSMDTIKWWIKSSNEENSSPFNNRNPANVTDAIIEFNYFIANNALQSAWCNHTLFDFVILDNLFRQVIKKPFPIRYYNQYDMATVKEIRKLFGLPNYEYNTQKSHNALHDAINQANLIIDTFSLIGVK